METRSLRGTRTWMVVAALALAASAFRAQPAAAAEPVTAFTLDSEPNDYVGAGQSLAFTPANATVTASGSATGVTFNATDANHWFYAQLAPPSGQGFSPGPYDAARFPSETVGGLDVFGDGRGCNQTAGTFTVLEASFTPDGSLETFAATYEQHCEGGPSALFGELRYASSVGFSAATNEPASVDFGDVGLAERASASIHIANAGTTSLDLGQADISGAASADHSITTDGCSGTTLAPGGSCTLDVSFTPTQDGVRAAMLSIPDGTARGQRQVPLTGTGSRLSTKVLLSVSKRKADFGTTVRLTAHLNEFEATIDKDLTIFATPYGDAKRAIATGPVDGSGDLHATFTMKKETTFVASFSGGDAYEPDVSPSRVVQVFPLLRGKLTGTYGRSGRYELYHFRSSCPASGDGCPTYVATVTPDHDGKRVVFQLQVYVRGAWRTALSFRLRLDGHSKAEAIFVYGDRRIIGIPTRVRFSFGGDADHLARTSTWSYFKVTA